MICENCKNKPIARGIKRTECCKCGKHTIVNYAYKDICTDCSEKYHICQYCGESIIASKPPLGVMPLHIFEESRALDLAKSLYEYLRSGNKNYELLEKWAEELRDRIWNLKNMEE